MCQSFRPLKLIKAENERMTLRHDSAVAAGIMILYNMAQHHLIHGNIKTARF